MAQLVAGSLCMPSKDAVIMKYTSMVSRRMCPFGALDSLVVVWVCMFLLSLSLALTDSLSLACICVSSGPAAESASAHVRGLEWVAYTIVQIHGGRAGARRSGVSAHVWHRHDGDVIGARELNTCQPFCLWEFLPAMCGSISRPCVSYSR